MDVPVCKHVTKNFLKQFQESTSLVLISSTISILIERCFIVNSIKKY